jgi:uracil-DNA glycosylase
MTFDLFNQKDPNEILSLNVKPVLGSWYHAIPVDTLMHLDSVIETVKVEYHTKSVQPAYDDIFRIYQDLSLEDIKVVIIGQDPYPNANADGYAFSCMVNYSPSLRQIYKAILKDLNITKQDYDGYIFEHNLDHWVEQGIFLLNSVLTTEQGNSGSHSSLGWQEFTSKTVEVIAKESKNVVFLLWGSFAKKYNSIISKYAKRNNHLVLSAQHPVSASYNNTDWVCDHFSKTNEFLARNSKTQIQWFKKK